MILGKKEDISQFNAFLVPDALVDQYLAECNPVYLKTYLYAVRQLFSGCTNLSNAQIAAALNVAEVDVANAFLYFASKGLVRIPNFTGIEHTDFDVEFRFGLPTAVRETERRPSYKSSDIARHLDENPKMRQMYTVVRDLLGKNLSSAETNILYSFYDWYGLPVEVILVLVEHCVSKGKRGMRSIEKEAGKWADAGIDTVEKANAYIKKKEKFLTYAYRVQSALGLNSRRLTAKELAFLDRWSGEWNTDVALVQAAYELTVDKIGKLSFAYMDRVLESWHERGIARPEEIATKDVRRTEPSAKPTQAGEYDYNELERKLTQRRIARIQQKERMDNGV